jgi:Ca2+-transporting ATPase
MFGIALDRGLGEGEARALTFTTLVVANIALIFANRSWERTILASLRIPNRSLWLITGAATLCLALVLQVPLLRDLFHFAPLERDALLLAVAAGLASIAWFELFKLVRNLRLPR